MENITVSCKPDRIILAPSTSEHKKANQSDDNAEFRPDNKTTDTQTMMHMLKANIGTGVLAMPMAFKNVGLWVGFVFVPVIGAICTYCMNILIQSHNHLCDRFNYESLDYDQVAALSFALGPKFLRRKAKFASYVVLTFLLLSQIGFCCVFVTFVVENIQVSIANLLQIRLTSTAYLLIIFPIVALTSSTSNLKHMARITTTANILQLAGLALIFIDLVQPRSTSNAAQAIRQNGTSSIMVESVATNFFNGLPLFFATAVYAFEGIGVVLPLVKEMEYPGRISGISGVLNTSMCLIAILYMAMGFFGYLKYGQYVQGSISLNLPLTTANELVRLMYASALCLSYSIQFYVPWTIIWPFIDESLFYSYRPRETRDKLQILDRLSENEWDLSHILTEECRDDFQQDAIYKNQQERDQPFNDDCDKDSIESTLATSYAYSMQNSSTTHLVIGNKQKASLLSSNPPQANQYGSLGTRRTRNRFDDVSAKNDDTCEVPDVHWRPPPLSMRGKRRIVRFSLVVIFVSITFVFSALIPRLDLFISLVGAFAASSLAIIFPAIIQLSTFWSFDNNDDDNDEENECDLISHQENSSHGRERKFLKKLKKLLLWYLFCFKNILLILFGILGLVTGTWISIRDIIDLNKVDKI